MKEKKNETLASLSHCPVTHHGRHLERCRAGFCRKGCTRDKCSEWPSNENEFTYMSKTPRAPARERSARGRNVRGCQEQSLGKLAQLTRTSSSRYRPSPGPGRQRGHRSQRQQSKPHLQRLDGRCCTKGEVEVSKQRKDEIRRTYAGLILD